MDPLTILAMAAEAVQHSETSQSEPEFSIRKARPADIPLLERVERSAAELFRTVGLGFLLDGPTVDPSFLMANTNHLWVAVDWMDRPIGFLVGENLDGSFHIVEVSVAQEFQGRGVGKQLMARMTEEVRREGYKTITLTTYRNLLWNGPWYTRMGFLEVNPLDMGTKYLEILENERQHGLDMTQRCVMLKVL
jgi:ribosomal protein S18 acetylase RimI-like enzyme